MEGMNSIAAALERVGDDLLDVVGEAFAGNAARGLSETDVLEVMAAAARIVRAGEALLVETTGQVCDRSDGRLNADRMTTLLRMRVAERTRAAGDAGVEELGPASW